MIHVLFDIRTPKAVKKSQVRLTFSYPGNRFSYDLKIYTEKTKKGTWDFSNGRFNRDQVIKQDKLNDASRAIREVYEQLIKAGESITNERLKVLFELTEIDGFKVVENPKQPVVKTEKKLSDYFETYRTENAHLLAQNTLKKFTTTQNIIIAYELEKGIKLRFSDINKEFGIQFTKWMVEQKYLNNTIAKTIQILKRFMEWSLEKKPALHSNYEFKQIKWSQEQYKDDIIPLNRQEIERVKSLDLSNHPDLKKYRDIMLILINTGVSWVDISKLNKQNYKTTEDGLGYFIIERQKSGIEAMPPCDAETLGILSKYKWVLPNISSQNTNYAIKELCRLAEINEPIKLVKKAGTNEITIGDHAKPKWTFMSTRRMRQTFITLSGNDPNQPLPATMLFSGHKKPQTSMRYIKTDIKQYLKNRQL